MRAMVVEALDIKEPKVYVEAITMDTLNPDESETYLNTMVAKTLDEHALAVKNDGMDWKPWIIDSGCSSNFSLNQSEFINYIPYPAP